MASTRTTSFRGEEPTTSVLREYGLTDTPYVLWVGSLEPRKGVGVLVAAMARLARRGTATALVLAGYAGWQNSRLIPPGQRAQLGGSLHQLGPVPETDLQALYAGANVFAFPSFHEGFGLPVLEAMAAGAPVVASDIPAIREVAGDAAVLVPPGDVEQWVGALEDVLGSPSRRAVLAEAGRQRRGPVPVGKHCGCHAGGLQGTGRLTPTGLWRRLIVTPAPRCLTPAPRCVTPEPRCVTPVPAVRPPAVHGRPRHDTGVTDVISLAPRR